MPGIPTSLGRVQLIYKGQWDSTTLYRKLDVVLYEGNSYISKKEENQNHTPPSGAPYNSEFWGLMAHKGDQGIQGPTGDFGTPTGTVEILPTGSEPTINIEASGPSTAKVFSFGFGIPAGPLGFDDVSATASSVAFNSNPNVDAEVVTSGDSRNLIFHFDIPAAQNANVASVDNIGADASGNVNLTAIRYGVSQSLSSAQQLQARQNIGINSYIAVPTSLYNEQFLYYDNSGNWIGKSINEVPSGSTSDIGKFLAKDSNGMSWAQIETLPSNVTVVGDIALGSKIFVSSEVYGSELPPSSQAEEGRLFFLESPES